jgi:hypothetical protein
VLALMVLLCLAVVCLFGMPATLVLLPEPLRRWWPVALPFTGFATLVVVMQIPATIFSAGVAAWPVTGGMIALTGLALLRGFRLPRPTVWAVGVIVVALLLGAFALHPSIRLRAPRPSGIINNDDIYYLSVDQWEEHHGLRDAPPAPRVDGFYYSARQAYNVHLRIGVDLADVVTSRIGGTDPINTLPILTALYVALAGIAICLFVVALGGPPWLAVVAAILAAARPDLVRLGLDSFVAQTAGIALFVTAIAAVLLAIRDGGWRTIGWAGLMAAALVGTYTEISPAYVASALAICLVLVIANRRGYLHLLVRLLAVAAVACLIDPLAIYDGLRSLSSSEGLTGVAIVPFFGVIPDIGLVSGPYSVVDIAGGVGLMVAVSATALGLASLLDEPPLTRWLITAALAGGGALLVREAWLDPFSYGVYKALSLLSPFVALGLALGLRGPTRGLRVAAGLCLLALVGFNLQALVTVSTDAVNGATGMPPGDRQLADYQKVVGPANHSVALEGADRAATPPAAEHFGVYWLRFLEHEHVTFAPNQLSYFRDPSLGPYQSDATYSADYEDVASLGPSVTHTDAFAALGEWDIYRRAGNADLLMVGAQWTASDPTPFDLGEGTFWLSATHPAQVRLTFQLAAPTAQALKATVLIDGKRVITRTIRQTHTTVVTRLLAVPAGRTIVLLKSQLNTPIAPGTTGTGVEVISASVLQ